jgi:hypothetical protein
LYDVSIMIYYANNHCLIIDRLFAGVRGNLTQLTVSRRGSNQGSQGQILEQAAAALKKGAMAIAIPRRRT